MRNVYYKLGWDINPSKTASRLRNEADNYMTIQDASDRVAADYFLSCRIKRETEYVKEHGVNTLMPIPTWHYFPSFNHQYMTRRDK